MKSIFRNTVAAGAGLALALGAISASAAALKGHELAAQAKVSLDQARAVALKARPGTIVDQELEKEAGGSGLRYSFDMKAGKATYELGVDAITGKLLENGAETAAQEASETKADHKGHKKGHHEGKEAGEAGEAAEH